MRRAASLSGILAALGLLVAPASAGATHVRSCNGGFVDLPIKPDGKAPHDKGCPSACHAPLCDNRKRRAAAN